MNAGSRTYSIKDLEVSCGIKAHTIRMWEKRYGILKPERSDSNIRHYTEEEFKKLITISILNRNGLKISKIAKLGDNELLKEVMKHGTVDETADQEFRPGDLIMPALRFSEQQFTAKLLPVIREMGMREAYIKVLYPLIQKAKALWLTDCISRAQEQFIRHVVRTLLTSEDISSDNKGEGEPAAIINLGDGDGENNLIFVKYLLKKKGYDVIYTEGTLQPDDIKGIHEIRPFTILVLNIPASVTDDEARSLCDLLCRQLRLKKVVVTGRYGGSPWHIGKTEAISTPAGLAAWADEL